MQIEVMKAGKILSPDEKVIVWKIGDYYLIKKIDEKKTLEKVDQIREELKNKGRLLSDEEVVKTVKEARKEWKKLY